MLPFQPHTGLGQGVGPGERGYAGLHAGVDRQDAPVLPTAPSAVAWAMAGPATLLQDFEAACRADGAEDQTGWEHSMTVCERALERVFDGLGLAPESRTRALLACARHVHPFALAQGREEALELGSGLFDDNGYDPTALAQLDCVQAWLDHPDGHTARSVARAVDESRQLQMWDDEVRPPPGQGWGWMVEVADLLCRSVKQTEGGQPDRDQAYPQAWPAGVAARRALVCALKVRVRQDEDAAARELLAVIAEALG